MSIAVAAVRAHQNKYKKDFHASNDFLMQYIDKSAPTPNVKVISVSVIECQVAEDQHYPWHFQRKD